MPRRAARVDANQPEIVQALRDVGASVLHLHMVGHGCPDILVGYHGQNWLMEIKTEYGDLTGWEHDFMDAWRGQVTIVRDKWQAFDVIGLEYDG